MIEYVSSTVEHIRRELGKIIVGQDEPIEQILVALLAEGHALIEGVPGTAKTLTVKTLSRILNAAFGRIQFTPDLMPSDITGTNVFNMSSSSFSLRRGPVFTDILLADEINRTPPKTQAALLEAMEERQVTIDGELYPLSPMFTVLATENPIEYEGTYPLPEAQLDRFLLKVLMPYPPQDEEVRMVERVSLGRTASDFDLSRVRAVAAPSDILAMQLGTALVRVDAVVLDYAVRIARATREWPGIAMGAGPRGSLSLVRAARAQAVLDGRD